MICKKLIINEIKAEMNRIKALNTAIYTNYFFSVDNRHGELFETVISDMALAFVANDNGINRVYFYATDYDEMRDVLAAFSKDCFVEIITRNLSDYSEILSKSGFLHDSTFIRVTCSDIKRTFDRLNIQGDDDVRICGELAKKEDAALIYDALTHTFNTRTSHIDLKQVLKQIEQNTVWIMKEGNSIDALLIYKIEGKKYYLYQLFNNIGKGIATQLLLQTLWTEFKNGAVSSYAWVDSKNDKAIKLYEKFDMKFDGLYCVGYINEILLTQNLN